MAAQTTAYWDKDIYFIGCLITCGAYHHLMWQKRHKKFKGRMLRQSLSLKPSFKIRGNPIVSLRGSFWANWYAETWFIFKPSLK